MAFPIPEANYRNFRLKNIRQAEYRHVLYLLFWPILGLRYILVERVIIPEQYFEVHCFLDDWIPFHEGFAFPYLMWYLLITGMHLYTFFYDVAAFKRYSQYLLVSFSISTLTFLLFPTCQNLRPTEFPRDNLLTDTVGLLYCIDTNTNVCPSEHVIGSIAAFLAWMHTKGKRNPGVTAALAVTAVLASIATVFLKQHSLVDVAAALPVCAVAYLICYGRKEENVEKHG